MNNPRNGKIVYSIWLIKSEEESLNESLNMIDENEIKRKFAISNIAEIIDTANKRGDFEKR